MKKLTEAQLRQAARQLSKRGAKKGGVARWEGKTAEERRAHALMMVEARRKDRHVNGE